MVSEASTGIHPNHCYLLVRRRQPTDRKGFYRITLFQDETQHVLLCGQTAERENLRPHQEKASS